MNLEIDRNELPEKLETEDKWILSRLNSLVGEVTENLDKFELGIAAEKIYDFIWDSYCDWYIELTKTRLQGNEDDKKISAQKVLCYVLTETLKLLHPFMPFITEEIWQSLPHEGEALMVEQWPVYMQELSFPEEEADMESIMKAIKAVRALRAEKNVPPSKKSRLIIVTDKDSIFKHGEAFMMKLAFASEIDITETAPENLEEMAVTVTDDARIFIPMAQLVDIEKELLRIDKELKKSREDLSKVNAKLQNPGFVEKAPEHVVNGEREKAARLEALIENLTESRSQLEKIKS
jgi:valyl-tRNA synthetase